MNAYQSQLDHRWRSFGHFVVLLAAVGQGLCQDLPRTPAITAAATPWHQILYLANGGYWPRRAPVTITNGSDETLAGEPLALSLPGLAGETVKSLRVCRADGVELLFDLRDANGVAKRAGRLECGRQTHRAGRVPCPRRDHHLRVRGQL